MHMLVTLADGKKVMVVGGEGTVKDVLAELADAVKEARELDHEEVTFGGHVVPYYYVKDLDGIQVFKDHAKKVKDEAPAGMFEKVLVLSSAHVTQDIRDWLASQVSIRLGEGPTAAQRLIVDPIGEYGFRICVGTENDGLHNFLLDQETPDREPLRNLLRYAIRVKADWLALDRDVEPDPHFDTFDEQDPEA